MGGKHKKFLRSEKAKVKLKGVKLPKGLNATKTDFKVKKIVIREQLKESIYEDGKRKKNLKEVLTRLKHHNSSFRMDALRSLKECLATESDEVFRCLGALVQGIAAVCLDIEKDMRRGSFKAMTTLFSLVPPAAIEPFFDVISSYLRCAMTHIQQAIQEDSLLMLDVLLIHVPHLVATKSNKIWSNFLDVISKFRADAKPGRTLTMHVGNKTTTIKWRSKILQRLQGMLCAMIEQKEARSMQNNKATADGNDIRKLFIPNVPMHFPLVRWNLNRTCDLSAVLIRSGGQVVKENDSSRLKTYILQLLPLLFESWLEVRTSDKDQRVQRGLVLLVYDAAATLKTILNILVSLAEMAVICDAEENNDAVSQWFRENCQDEFNEHFMNGFPYQQAEGSKVSKTKSKGHATDREVMESGGQFCLNQNLNLIRLFCILNVPLKAINKDQASRILQFLTHNIDTFKQCPADWISPLPNVLREILYTSGNCFLRIDEESTKTLLRTILSCFQNNAFGRDNKSKILAILCDIILRNDLYKSFGPQEFDLWILGLPGMLCRPQVSQNIILTLSKLGKQKSMVFLEALRKSINPVIENLLTINISGCDDQFEGRKNLMNMFYWIDNWTNDEKTKILEHVNKHITDDMAANYFRFVLSEAFQK